MEQSKHQSPVSDLGQSVRSDLEYLAKNWTRSLDEATVRRDSAVLRRLLLDGGGTLRRYRQELRLKGEPKIRAINLRGCDTGRLVLSQACCRRRCNSCECHDCSD